MNKNSTKKLDKIWLFFAPLFVVLTGLDQLSKAWALDGLTQGKRVDFGFELSFNDGIAFGLNLPGWAIWVVTFLVLALGVYLVIENKMWQDKWHLTGLALIFSGAVGNMIDRFRFGYVVDFLKVYWWPNFNLADSFILIGVVILAYEFLIRESAIEEI